jgi:hypothetical protein
MRLPPQEPYAPVLTGGRVVDEIWRRLLDRAGPRDRRPLTDDPDLHVVVDGARVDAIEQTDLAHILNLPAMVRSGSVDIASRAAAPQALGLARDPRVLGVALRRIVIRAGSKFRAINVADGRLAQGFHDYEPDSGVRWTDGKARMSLDLFEGFSGRTELVLQLGGATKYPIERPGLAGAFMTAAVAA